MKKLSLSYSDFPEIVERGNLNDEILNLINSGRRVNSQAIARYFKITRNSAEKRLAVLEEKNLVKSELKDIQVSKGITRKSRIYFKK